MSTRDVTDLVIARVRLRAELRWDELAAVARDAARDAVARDVAPGPVVAAELAKREQARSREERREHGAALHVELAQIEQQLADDGESRLAKLVALLGLDGFEIDVLHACWAQAIEPALARLLLMIAESSDRGHLSETLIARLFRHAQHVQLGSESSLRTFAIVREHELVPGAPPVLSLDPNVRAWLLGHQELDDALVGRARLVRSAPALRDWPVESTVARLTRLLEDESRPRLRLIVRGRFGSGRATFAAVVARALGHALLCVDSSGLDELAFERVYVRAQRQAYLGGVALAWRGEPAAQRPMPAALPPFPLQFVIAEPGQAVARSSGMVDFEVTLDTPGPEERNALWRSLVPAASAWPEAELSRLGAAHRVEVGDIADVARKRVNSVSDALEEVRAATRRRIGDLGERLECPFAWDDLVLPANLRAELQDLVFEAGERASFWSNAEARRLFPQGRGLVALFSGPPGTGKTMAAQVLAARLGTELYRINLATIVSKWVGETARNLEHVLARAASTDVVLFFDEADALFAKRTNVEDAQDRFANTDTNYLLQAIESYQGIAILASNRKGNIDAAFLRRLRYCLDFPAPDEAMRAALWRSTVARLGGLEIAAALESQLTQLAASVELTGAQIKAAVLHAAFGARHDAIPMTLAHLLRGLERELLKEGRTLQARARERLVARA